MVVVWTVVMSRAVAVPLIVSGGVSVSVAGGFDVVGHGRCSFDRAEFS